MPDPPGPPEAPKVKERELRTFRVSFHRNGVPQFQDVEAESYKTESSKHVTLYINEQPIATFFDIDNVVAIIPLRDRRTSKTKKVQKSLEQLMNETDDPTDC